MSLGILTRNRQINVLKILNNFEDVCYAPCHVGDNKTYALPSLACGYKKQKSKRKKTINQNLDIK